MRAHGRSDGPTAPRREHATGLVAAGTRSPLHPAALASVSYGIVLVRVRVRRPSLSKAKPSRCMFWNIMEPTDRLKFSNCE